MAEVPPEIKDLVDTEVKKVVKTILKKCKEEKVKNDLQVPLTNYEDRVSYYTAFPKTFIHNLIEEIEEENINFNERYLLPLYYRIQIQKCLKSFYEKTMYPTYLDIYTTLQLENNLPKMINIHHFRREMNYLGYEYKNHIDGHLLLLEDPEQVFERFRYLNKLRKLRFNKVYIYYCDERIIDKTFTFKKPIVENSDISMDIDGYILLHLISRKGYENGLFFCGSLTTKDYFKWIVDIVLPHLKPSSAIILDNSPLHGNDSINQVVSKYSSKADMLKWLKNNNIPHNIRMRKSELYDLITNCTVTNRRNMLDQILQAHGHQVLRLPCKYYELNPTEYLWDHIKTINQNIDKNFETIVELKNKVMSSIMSISVDKWLEFEQVIVKTEDELFTIDEEIENAIELYNLKESTSLFDNNAS